MISALTTVGPMIVSYGVWGVVAVLICIIVWLIQKLLNVLDSTNKIISDNTQALFSLDTHIVELREVQAKIRDNLLTRPCQMDKS